MPPRPLALIIAVIALVGCSGGPAYEGQLADLRQAVTDHAGAVEQAASPDGARTETGRYVDATSARMQSMMTEAMSCPMMDRGRMQMAMGALDTALRRHRETMQTLEEIATMGKEAHQHASMMMTGIDALEGQYRACDCDPMM